MNKLFALLITITFCTSLWADDAPDVNAHIGKEEVSSVMPSIGAVGPFAGRKNKSAFSGQGNDTDDETPYYTGKPSGDAKKKTAPDDSKSSK